MVRFAVGLAALLGGEIQEQGTGCCAGLLGDGGSCGVLHAVGDKQIKSRIQVLRSFFWIEFASHLDNLQYK